LLHLFNLLPAHFHLPSETKAALESSFEPRSAAKNDLLIEEGHVCRHLYFLERGCIRGFANIDGKEVTQWFGFEHDFVTSFRSFISRSASREYIQVVEDADLWCISKDQLEILLEKFPELEKLVRLIYEQYYIRLEDRYSNAHFKSAGERYEDLLKFSPHILERMPLGYIASYLGISAETLSRIRGKQV